MACASGSRVALQQALRTRSRAKRLSFLSCEAISTALEGLKPWSIIAVVARNFPSEQNVFPLRSLADVVHNQMAAAFRGLLFDHHPDVRHVAAKVPGDDVAGQIVCRIMRYGQCLALSAEEDHQIRHPAMVNIGVQMLGEPFLLSWVEREVLVHVLVDFFLEVDPNRAVRANDFVGTYAGVFGNIPARIGYANVGRIVTHTVMRSFFCRGDQLLEELLARNEVGRLGLGETVAGDERKSSAERCEDDAEPRTAI